MKKYSIILAAVLLLTACGQKGPDGSEPIDSLNPGTIEQEQEPASELEATAEPEDKPSPVKLFQEKMTDLDQVSTMTETERVYNFPESFALEYMEDSVALPADPADIDMFFTDGMELAEEKESSEGTFQKYRLNDDMVNIEKYANGSQKYALLIGHGSNIYYTQYDGRPLSLSMEGYTPYDEVGVIDGIHIGSTLQEVLDKWGPPDHCDYEFNNVRDIRIFSYMWTDMGENGKGYVSADFHLIKLDDENFELRLVDYSLQME